MSSIKENNRASPRYITPLIKNASSNAWMGMGEVEDQALRYRKKPILELGMVHHCTAVFETRDNEWIVI